MKSNTREERAPRHQEQTEAAPRTKSKSVKRGDSLVAENKMNTESDAPRQVFGLGGEMALAAATSKKAQQRIRKQLKQQEQEEEEQKALMERVAKEKAEAERAKLAEERKK